MKERHPQSGHTRHGGSERPTQREKVFAGGDKSDILEQARSVCGPELQGVLKRGRLALSFLGHSDHAAEGLNATHCADLALRELAS